MRRYAEQPRDFKVLKSVVDKFGIKGAGTIKINRKFRIMVGPSGLPGARWIILGFTNRNNQDYYNGERAMVR